MNCPGESVTIPLPPQSVSCTQEGICNVVMHEELADPVALLMDTIDSRDLEYLLTYVGGRVERQCRRADGSGFIPDCISQHAFGAAMDIRPLADNEPGRWNSIVDGDANMGRLIDLYARLGFGWGGNFNTNFDPQHFEFIGLSAAADDLAQSQGRGYHAP